jgi:hypothetical protein
LLQVDQILRDRSNETSAVWRPVKNLSGTKRLLEIEVGRRQRLERAHDKLKFWVLRFGFCVLRFVWALGARCGRAMTGNFTQNPKPKTQNSKPKTPPRLGR